MFLIFLLFGILKVFFFCYYILYYLQLPHSDSASGQDGVTGTRYIIPLKTAEKNDKIRETMIFKTLDIGND